MLTLRAHCAMILLCVLTVMAVAAPVRYSEDFSHYATGSDTGPNWQATGLGFSVRESATGKVLQADVADTGSLIWRQVPLAHEVVVEAMFTPQATTGSQWKVGGIGVYWNTANYWHLALVEGPDSRRFAELSEMLNGTWTAQSEAATRLTTVEEQGGFDWQFGRAYRLRLTLTADRIIGEVFEGDTRRYRCVRLLDNKAVTGGRPMLTASHFQGSFAAVRADVDRVATPAEVTQAEPVPTFPPYPATKGHHGTGFFHAAQRGGVWWLVDPAGQPMLSIGTDHVNYNAHFSEKLGYAPYHRNVERRYGHEDAWAKTELARLKSWHFNVLASGNSPSLRHRGSPHTEFLSFATDFSNIAAIVPKTTWTGWPDVFDPRFAQFCDLRARERCARNRNDPWLLGYFLDNELEWWGKHGSPWGIAEEAWKLPPERAGKQALVASLRRFYSDQPASFNTDFASKVGRFDDLLKIVEPLQPATEHGRQALMSFVAEAAQRYFQIATAAVRKYDPHHLVLGCRFAHDAPLAAWVAAGQTCDVVSVNMYPRVDLERQTVVDLASHLRTRYAYCHKPILLTEWSFPALDAKDSSGRPIPSQHGAGMRVDTQAQKAQCYEIFQRVLFSLPFVVGSHYFMWADEPALGISSTFPEDSNYGLVNESDDPYALLTATAQRVNAQVHALHAGMTAELSVVIKQGDASVANRGRVPASFTLATWVNGKRTDHRLTLAPQQTRQVQLLSAHERPPFWYLRAECDPEHKIVERVKSDNVDEHIGFVMATYSLTPEPVPVRAMPLTIVLLNTTPEVLARVDVIVTDPKVTELLKRVRERHGSLQVTEDGLSVHPSGFTYQLEPAADGTPTLHLKLSHFAPYSARRFLPLEVGSPTKAPAVAPSFPTGHSGVTFVRATPGFTVDNGALHLVNDGASGNAFNHIYLRGTNPNDLTELGSYTPLIQQIVAGQNIWVHPDAVTDVQVHAQDAQQLVLDVTFAKMANPAAGLETTPKAEAQPFRCCVHLTFEPDRPYFLTQCLWVENNGPRAWQWAGYYHYPLSRIGGDAKNDEVGGPGVPNYWLNFGAWRDPALKVDYGVLLVTSDDRLEVNFWKDEGGGQHPDCHRKVVGELKPGQRWQPAAPEPVVAVAGLRETATDPRPWRALLEQLRARDQIQVIVF